MAVSAGFVAAAVGAYSAYSQNQNAQAARDQQNAAQAKADATKPQATQVPGAQTVSGVLAGQGQAGGAPGAAQTFLTGAGGVDPGTLNLGKSSLLGG